MKIFNCDVQWPLCLFDFTYKNRIPQFLCFRASNDPPVIIEDYFYCKSGNSSQSSSPERLKQSNVYKSVRSSMAPTYEGILIERGNHMCCQSMNFVENFKVLFDQGDNDLFGNPNL